MDGGNEGDRKTSRRVHWAGFTALKKEKLQRRFDGRKTKGANHATDRRKKNRSRGERVPLLREKGKKERSIQLQQEGAG